MTTRVGVAIANADALDVLQPRTNTGDGQTNTPSQTMHGAVVGFMLLFIGFGFVFRWNVIAQSNLSSPPAHGHPRI